MAELGDFSLEAGVHDATATVEMCDYGYVDECEDKKKLQGILQLLRSGKEGHYPELIKYTEDKLLTLMTPVEQQKILRLRKEVSPMDRVEAELGLTAWENSIQSADKSLTRKKNSSSRGDESQKLHIPPTDLRTKKLPPVRGAAVIPAPVKATTLSAKDVEKARISNNDDKEFNLRLSEREKLKGNEFYRVGEVEEAVRCYTRSIDLDPTNHILYANRAMGYIKLDAPEKAEADCTSAIAINCTYTKAWSRRGLARFKRGKYSESASDFSTALKLDPTSKDLPNLLQKSKDKYLEVEGKGEWKEFDASFVAKSDAIVEEFQTLIIEEVQNTKEFLSFLPVDVRDLVFEGVYTVIEGIEKEKEKGRVKGDADADSVFTRVPITFDDDEEDEEDRSADSTHEGWRNTSHMTEPETDSSQEGKNTINHTNNKTEIALGQEKAEKVSELESGYTRILISEEDSEEEDSEEDNDEIEGDKVGTMDPEDGGDSTWRVKSTPVKSTEENVVKNGDEVTASFTRISIQDDDENDEDGNDKNVAGEVIPAKTEEVSSDYSEDVHTATTAVENTQSTSTSNSATPQPKESRENSESLKLAGNEAMKSLDYQSALSLYTSSLELDQSNLLTRNNRSQAYLKLNNYQGAIKDATYVIENDPSYPGHTGSDRISSAGSGRIPPAVSAAVKKALYRRATAYSSLGGDNLTLSLSDLDLLLSFEPGNALARSERTRIAVLLRTHQKQPSSSHLGSGIVKNFPKELVKSSVGSVSVDKKSSSKEGNGSKSASVSGGTKGGGSVNGSGSGGGDILAERSTRRISPIPVAVAVAVAAAAKSESTSNSTGALREVTNVAPTAVLLTPSSDNINTPQSPTKSSESSTKSATNTDAITNSTQLSTLSKTSASVRTSKREPCVPQEVPKTLYELERAWRGLKDRPDLFAQYLTQNIHKKSVVKKVFKEAISPELLSSVFISLRDFCAVPVVLTILGGLSTVNHFSMTLALLAEDDLTCINKIFRNVLDLGIELDESARTSIMQLKLLYKM